MRLWIGVVALGAFCLFGCQPSAIGKAETDRAFPKQSQSDLEATLAKEGKLEEYKAAQERDRLYEQKGQQGASDPSPGPTGSPR